MQFFRFRHMLKAISGILFFTFISSAFSYAETTVTLLTDNSYKPYSFVEKNALQGSYIDVIKTLDREIDNFKIELQAKPWRQARQMVENGDAIGIIGTYFNAALWPDIYPYSQPIAEEQVVVVCAADSRYLNKTWPSGFAGALLANVAGYDGWVNNEVRSETLTKLINFIEVPNVDVAYNMVNKKNIDCTLFEKDTLSYLNSKRDVQPPVIAAHVSSETVHIGYSKKALSDSKFPFAAQFIKEMDIAIHNYKSRQPRITADYK
ncbi:MAG: transporter substrate-binding domain-containing protein [Alteromonadaceae bacterium]|nr:transporter substrate-binding domain-containing protein [Alteromonadaceae bacterium]